MSIDQVLKFYVTPPHNCSYLLERQATTLFADPNRTISEDNYAILTEHGFRRSGTYLYRPQCEHCNACQSIRIPINLFSATRSQRRILRKNQDLEIKLAKFEFQTEHYELYERYIRVRHSDGDMFPPDEKQYRSFLLTQLGNTKLMEYRLNGRLLAVSVLDHFPNALSAVYTFFDPDATERSLGTFAVLWQLEHARNLQLNYLYLGYYIRESAKMSYKTAFKPYELFIDDHWQKN